MKELFSKRAKKIITAVSLSCFLCSPVSYVYSMNQASAAALNTNVAYEQQFDTVGFDKDDHWNRGRSDEDKDWKKIHLHLAMMTEMISDHLVLIETMMIGLHHHLVMMMMTMIGIEIDLHVMIVTIEMTAMMIATKIMIKAISQLQY